VVPIVNLDAPGPARPLLSRRKSKRVERVKE